MAGNGQSNQAKRVELILQQIESLPTPSQVVVRLLEVTADERVPNKHCGPDACRRKSIEQSRQREALDVDA